MVPIAWGELLILLVGGVVVVGALFGLIYWVMGLGRRDKAE